jgi:hypothetical protein
VKEEEEDLHISGKLRFGNWGFGEQIIMEIEGSKSIKG